MKESVARLQRLHRLRCRLADAATLERERVAADARRLDQEILTLQATVASVSFHSGREARQTWSERQAELQIANSRQCAWIQQRTELVQARVDATERERAAVLEREQMRCMLDHREAELAMEDARREQGRMDDLFTTARVRGAMATNF